MGFKCNEKQTSEKHIAAAYETEVLHTPTENIWNFSGRVCKFEGLEGSVAFHSQVWSNWELAKEQRFQ